MNRTRFIVCGVLCTAGVAVTGATQAQLLNRSAPGAATLQKAPAKAVPGAVASVRVSGGPTSAVVTWTVNPLTLDPSVVQPRLTTAPLLSSAAAKATTKAGTAGAAPGVVVERLAPGAAPVRLALAPNDPAKAVDAGPLRPGVAVTYRVTVTDAGGKSSAMESPYTPPLPRDPQGLVATVAANGVVTLTWQPVPDAVGYQITGTALAAPVKVTYTTQWTSPTPTRPGAQQWKVASIYEPGGVLTPATTWSAVMSHTVPVPTRPFLFLPNGAGDAATSAAAYQQQCGEGGGGTTGFGCTTPVWFLGVSPSWDRAWGSTLGTGRVPPDWPIASFADLNDLGLGRRVNCMPLSGKPLNGVLCWATSHGHPPGTGAAPNGTQLALAAEQVRDVKSLNVIMMTSRGSFFGTYEAPPGFALHGRDPFEIETSYAEGATQRFNTTLDSQGPKFVPQACLSCHGGRYDVNRRIVIGASLLPLVPSHLTFSSPQARSANEEAIRRINRIILDTNPAPAIRDQITALYNGNPDAAGTPANDNAVPAGWAAQPGLYRQVVAPFCGTCHFAQTGPLNFASFANLQQHRQRVQRAVCADFSMPHSEQGLRRFWSQGGIVSLPGLLSTALGYSKCPE